MNRLINWLKSIFASTPKAQQPMPTTPSKPIPSTGWQPEWATFIRSFFDLHLDTFEKASDITKLRADYFYLTRDARLDMFVAFIKAIVYFECGYNPKSYSVDVGSKDNRNTWSVGLMQMSVTDQANYGFDFGFSFEDLQQPIPNLRLALTIMKKQVEKRGKFLIAKGEPGLYWATISPGGKYDSSPTILKGLKALDLAKLDSIPNTDPMPWYKIANSEIGQTEANNPSRVVQYHSATDLDKSSRKASTPWCASFVCWCLYQAGYHNTNSAWARDYLGYGKALVKPEKGCILVFERNAPGGDSHVTFWTGEETATHLLCLGGNQDDMVKLKLYPKKDLLGARWPVR